MPPARIDAHAHALGRTVQSLFTADCTRAAAPRSLLPTLRATTCELLPGSDRPAPEPTVGRVQGERTNVDVRTHAQPAAGAPQNALALFSHPA